MSARLNMNEIPFFSWKGKTFTQISSSIQKNGWTTVKGNNIFRAKPLKIYRREIASTNITHCNERISSRIDHLNMPNGSLIYESPSSTISYNGLKGTIDTNLTNNTTEHPGCTNTYLSTEINARNRVRSSGMIRRKCNQVKNNDSYYTSTNQFLVSRNRTFQQNQYNYIQKGDASLKPGDTLSVSNIYSPAGINHCPKYFISSDVSFTYIWIDSTIHEVDIKSGYYDINELNNAFKAVMNKNNHYLLNKFNNSQTYLLNMTYNNKYSKIELQCFIANTTIYNITNYKIPNGVTWSLTNTTVIPGFVISSNVVFQNAIGFSSGSYPVLPLTGTVVNQSFLSSYTPGIKPNYVPLYYKPNNAQFAQQGGVSASALIARVRYNSITKNTGLYYNAFGNSVANALAYGVSDTGYTIKDKIGYPLTKTPVFSKVTGQLVNSSSDCKVKHL